VQSEHGTECHEGTYRGQLNGTPNEFTTFNGVAVPVKDQFLW
jgi:hypothetical protein